MSHAGYTYSSPQQSFCDSVYSYDNDGTKPPRKRTSLDVYSKDVQEPMYQIPPQTDVTLAGTDILDDTIHYMSPISPISPRTVCEGDYMMEYPTLLRLLEGYGRGAVPEYSTTTTSSTISCEEQDLQRTLALVRPEAMQYQDVILRAVIEAGFSIIQVRSQYYYYKGEYYSWALTGIIFTLAARTIHLSPEQVSEIYAQYYGSLSFPHLVVSMSVGPILALSLAGLNAVCKWKDLVGPDKTLHGEWFYPMSVRVRFGLVGSLPNVLHASQNLSFATKENRYFFPENIIEPLLSEEYKVQDYLNLFINPTLLDGLTDVVKRKPVDPVLHLAEWLLINNPYQPRYPPEVAIVKT